MIDLKAFLGALVQIGYDGPVRAEPFNKTLNDMDDDAAIAATAAALRKALRWFNRRPAGPSRRGAGGGRPKPHRPVERGVGACDDVGMGTG